MKHVRLTLDAGGREAEFHPMYDVLANAPFVERAETIHVNFTGDDLGIMHHVEGDVEAFRDAIGDIDGVHECELTPAADGRFYAHLHCSPGDARVLFEALTQDRLIRVPPIVYRADGKVAVSLIGTTDVIQAAIDHVPDAVDVTVEQISGVARATGAAGSLLSERQRAALEAALDLGYYEIPRQSGHEDVADVLDCAPSTAAEHLRKAESKVVRSAFDSGGQQPESPATASRRS